MQKIKPTRKEIEAWKTLWSYAGLYSGTPAEPAELPYVDAREIVRDGRRLWILPDGTEVEAK